MIFHELIQENLRFLTTFGFFELIKVVDLKFDEDHENVNLFSDRPTNQELFGILKPEVKPEVEIPLI
ncbi:Uncharacterized protein APZ42_006881 [Daphnia magna]|uniref:Uncharacterized protein n=1 Tax=Daphnia magna TaxID=35525 RepID=A0A164FN65_9CRUS|nr:Uncharacterized protein APZ42_006881 [Daphnia magna]